MSNTAIWCRRFGVPEEILQIENTDTEALKENYIRVKMNLSPINASDLIPVTGAYGHRITPPFIVGYEGVGEVLVATDKWSHLKGRRVLPLRGPGTWQSIADCNAELAIPVPTNISDELAARAYINPLAALMMLRFFPVKGKRVLLTAAGSDCALYLGQWAIRFGAKSVAGIHRSPIHHKKFLHVEYCQ